MISSLVFINLLVGQNAYRVRHLVNIVWIPIKEGGRSKEIYIQIKPNLYYERISSLCSMACRFIFRWKKNQLCFKFNFYFIIRVICLHNKCRLTIWNIIRSCCLNRKFSIRLCHNYNTVWLKWQARTISRFKIQPNHYINFSV